MFRSCLMLRFNNLIIIMKAKQGWNFSRAFQLTILRSSYLSINPYDVTIHPRNPISFSHKHQLAAPFVNQETNPVV